MVGTAAPVMKQYIRHPLQWVLKNKLRSILGMPISIDDVPNCDVGRESSQGNLRGGELIDAVNLPYQIEDPDLREAEIQRIEVENV